MRGIVARRLRKEAARLATLKPEESKIRVFARQVWAATKKGEPNKLITVAGTHRYPEGSRQRIYRNLKRANRPGQFAGINA
jgi:hypothetical protein